MKVFSSFHLINHHSWLSKILFFGFFFNQISEGDWKCTFGHILINACQLLLHGVFPPPLQRELVSANTQKAPDRYNQNYRIKNLPFGRDFINIIILCVFLPGLSPWPLRFPVHAPCPPSSSAQLVRPIGTMARGRNIGTKLCLRAAM